MFNKDKLSIYDPMNMKIEVSRGVLLKGWHVPGKGQWRIHIGKNIRTRKDVHNSNTYTHLVNQSPINILRKAAPTMKGFEQLDSAYEIKKTPQLIKYFHAAAGFPTKTTWLEALNNGHYSSWIGLSQKTLPRI